MLNLSPVNLVCIVLNLLILLALMKKFLYKPVLGVIAKRQELIDSQFAKAKQCEEEAQQKKAWYEEAIAESEHLQIKMMKEAKVHAEAECNRMLAEAAQQAQNIVEAAKKTASFEKEKSVKEAETEIVKLAVMAAEKLTAKVSEESSEQEICEEFQKKAGDAE